MAIYKLLELHEIPFESPDFIKEYEICASYLNGMVEAIVYTIKNVWEQRDFVKSTSFIAIANNKHQ